MSQHLLLDISNAPARSRGQALRHANLDRTEQERVDRRNELRRERSKLKKRASQRRTSLEISEACLDTIHHTNNSNWEADHTCCKQLLCVEDGANGSCSVETLSTRQMSIFSQKKSEDQDVEMSDCIKQNTTKRENVIFNQKTDDLHVDVETLSDRQSANADFNFKPNPAMLKRNTCRPFELQCFYGSENEERFARLKVSRLLKFDSFSWMEIHQALFPLRVQERSMSRPSDEYLESLSLPPTFVYNDMMQTQQDLLVRSQNSEVLNEQHSRRASAYYLLNNLSYHVRTYERLTRWIEFLNQPWAQLSLVSIHLKDKAAWEPRLRAEVAENIWLVDAITDLASNKVGNLDTSDVDDMRQVLTLSSHMTESTPSEFSFSTYLRSMTTEGSIKASESKLLGMPRILEKRAPRHEVIIIENGEKRCDLEYHRPVDADIRYHLHSSWREAQHKW